MTNSPAWDDINPALSKTDKADQGDLMSTARQVRQLAEHASQLAHEGQLNRARNALNIAREKINEHLR